MRSNAIVTITLVVCLMVALALLIWQDLTPPDQAAIGGTNVPAVECAEDETIWWTGIDTLGCVHYEEVQ